MIRSFCDVCGAEVYLGCIPKTEYSYNMGHSEPIVNTQEYHICKECEPKMLEALKKRVLEGNDTFHLYACGTTAGVFLQALDEVKTEKLKAEAIAPTTNPQDRP